MLGKSSQNLNIIKRVFSFSAPYKKRFVFTAILTVFLSVLAPLRTILIQRTLDNQVLNKDEEGLLMMTIILIVLLLLNTFVQYYQTYQINWIGQSVVRDLRKKLFTKILNFRLKYYDKNAIGTLVTRVVSDMETIAEIFSQGILIIFSDLLQLLVVIITMFVLDPVLTLFVLIPIPLLLWATNIFKNAVKRAFKDVRTQISKINAFVQERISGMSIVQIFNREEKEYDNFKQLNRDHRKAHIKTIWAYSIFLPTVEILSAMSLGLLIWWGARGVIDGYTSYGNLVAFILFIYMLFRPIRQLADRFNSLQMGVVAAERVFAIMDTEDQIEETGDIDDVRFEGDIEFKDVWFSYKEDEFVVKGVSFEVKKGETVAIVGATGAGKTSIINILTRLYDFQKGEINVDGVNIRDLTKHCLRSNIITVLQEVFLFSDSIYKNITLNNPSITREEVIQAAKNVGVHDFISNLPDGYDYYVHERGTMLSAGQRQLISFLRAYVYNPSILILDEATSSIDTESERMVQMATDKLTEGRTSIVIAHRLATIQRADKIIVMDKGKIVETGNHQELIRKDGYYKKLHDYQFKSESDEV